MHFEKILGELNDFWEATPILHSLGGRTILHTRIHGLNVLLDTGFLYRSYLSSVGIHFRLIAFLKPEFYTETEALISLIVPSFNELNLLRLSTNSNRENCVNEDTQYNGKYMALQM